MNACAVVLSFFTLNFGSVIQNAVYVVSKWDGEELVIASTKVYKKRRRNTYLIWSGIAFIVAKWYSKRLESSLINEKTFFTLNFGSVIQNAVYVVSK
jgi:hypothetical protein